ncbi:MAG: hypothetical protein QXP73_06280 [Candidatus Methanomethylicaceae archaeon]|nr:hypothetical protein [Candidatus Verstraetearchaeota archaeon]
MGVTPDLRGISRHLGALRWWPNPTGTGAWISSRFSGRRVRTAWPPWYRGGIAEIVTGWPSR